MRLRTYAQVWRLERVIYQIEGVNLPFAITMQQMMFFAGCILVMAFLSKILPGLSRVGAVARYLILPAFVTWFLTRQRLDGKAPHRWVWKMLLFLSSPKRLNRLQPLRHIGKQRVRFYIGTKS